MQTIGRQTRIWLLSFASFTPKRLAAGNGPRFEVGAPVEASTSNRIGGPGGVRGVLKLKGFHVSKDIVLHKERSKGARRKNQRK